MKKKYIGLIAVVVLILAVLLPFIIYNQWPLLTGKKIVLATLPVDPFDPIRGQYIVINYEISQLDNAPGYKAGDSIYVLLKEDDKGIWRQAGVSSTKPTEGDFIKGKVKSVGDNNLRIEYGIEQYFFERNADLPTRNITIEVAIAKSGRPKIVQLLYKGKPVEIKYKEFDIKR